MRSRSFNSESLEFAALENPPEIHERPRTPPMRDTPLRVQLRIRPLQQRRSRDHRASADKGADESIRLLAYLGARLIEPAAHDWRGGPFWKRFKDNKGRVRDPTVWQRIVAEGGDEGTPESLRNRIRMLGEAKVHDPRDGTSW